MKVTDSGGNISDLSNVTQGGTPCIENCEDGFALRPIADSPFALTAPSPNPVAGAVWFHYSIPGARAGEPFELALFDASGRKVRTIEQGGARAGENAVQWDLLSDNGDRVAAGMYFLRLRLGADQRSQSVMVLR